MDGRRRPHWAEAAFQAYRPGKVHVTSGGFVEAYEGLIAVGEDGWLDYASETWTGPDGRDGSDTILTRFPRERVELYYADGSLVSFASGSPQGEKLLPIARRALAAARG